MARSDVEVVLLYYEPNVELWMSGMDGVGIGGCYTGHGEMRALYADLDEAWGEWEWTVRKVVDGGRCLAVKADFVAHGRSSGLELNLLDGGTTIRLSDRGKVEWQAWFGEPDGSGWQKALEAGGLSE